MNRFDTSRWRPFGRPSVLNEPFRDRVVEVNPHVIAHVNHYLETQVPKLLQKKLDNDLEEMLQDHLQQVRERLIETVDIELRRIIDDPEYHQVNQSFYRSIERQVEERVNDYIKRSRIYSTIFIAGFAIVIYMSK